jgi:hypothetical protein
MSDADTCKPGDPDPSVDPGDCPARLRHYVLPPYFCTRNAGHAGQHLAGTEEDIVAVVWTGEGDDAVAEDRIMRALGLWSA